MAGDGQGPYEVDIEEVEYLRHGDKRFLARVFRPRGQGPFPAVIDAHGGAWCRGDRTNNDPINEAVARGGVVVAALDFRNPPDAIYPGSVADVNYGVRWLKSEAARFDSAPGMVGAMGTSSGGHLVVLAALKFYDIAKYITLVEDTHIPDMAMMSKKFYDKLPPDLQKAVMDVGRELERYMEDVVIRYDRRAAQLWKSKGGEVIRLSTAERNEFMRRTLPIGDKVMGGDPEVADMYNLLKKAAKRNRLTDHENKKGSGL